MAQEIEKKFLVKGDFKPEAFKATRITQGYLSSVPERTVRIRVKGDKGFITVKGIGYASGAARFEWEKEIPVEDVRALLDLAEPGVITRPATLSRIPTASTPGRLTSSTATTTASPWPKSSSPTRTSPSTSPPGSAKRSPAIPGTSTPCS